MKKLTCRSWEVSNAYKVQKLNQLIRGWINYFKIGSMKGLCAKNGRTDTISSTHVHMETLEIAKEQRKDVGKAGLKQTVSTRDILCKGICQNLHELEYLQMYKQRTVGKVWTSLNVRLLHNKVCCLLS